MTRNNNKESILVIKLGALGDFLQALGPMAAIRKHHKDAAITLLTTAPFQELAEKCGYFDQIWIDEKPGRFDIPRWLKLRKGLNERNFTRIYDLQNNDRTCFYFKLLKSKNKPEWVGVAKGASHRNTSPMRIAGHAFDGHVQTLALADIQGVEIDRLEWMKEDITGFSLHKPYVLLIPGSAPNRPEKRWPAEKYGHLAQEISSLGYQPVVLGTESEKDSAAQILQLCPKALDLTGQTSLFQIAQLARGAASAIGNDTGPMHLIAATDCPCVVLFSKHSNPVRHAPRGKQVQIIQKENLPDLNPEDVLEKFFLGNDGKK